MGGLPEDKCTSEAFCSNIKLKKASIFAIHTFRAIYIHIKQKTPTRCKQLNKANEIKPDLARLIKDEIEARGRHHVSPVLGTGPLSSPGGLL